MLGISPFDNITISPVHILAALRKSLLKIRRRAVRDIFSEPSFSSTVNVVDCRVAILCIEPGSKSMVHDNNNSTQIFCQRQMRTQSLLWSLTLLNSCFTVLGSATERFDEHLILRTLQDGKVTSKFTFTTLLKGASPRDPKTLDASDECG